MEKPTTEGTGKPTVSDKDIDNLAHGVLSIYEKPFKTIESQLEELLVKQNKIINTIQIINNNKDKNYKSKILILEEICARINDLIMQIKNNHVRMIEITKTVKTMKTQALKVKKYSLEQAAKHQEQLMKEQNLVAKLPSPS
ncbi:uncharacterized protein LOC103508927 isoform X1 [Diaphorina citri]|uniref:Uncharacterized protein LOC103508927 isoform X1 n=1 Tax=Diaphorina citri TaxID=121845 RepID=A0A1S3D0S9_DIACI|nr:uncharacterized protein LOC103508927 isoform X1 [Diaphorina citri]XP_008471731.1 uncharacterized protein LOC103508927 isoform X1 [Diaphorina citri]KAI5695840.1 hypothetical protein M8J75_004402 [Diaphorina citri]KAI5722586.1 hypothetical protein M8J76_010614 [Diaphorina citri]